MLNFNPNNLVLQKAILEVRHNDMFSIPDARYKIIDKFVNDFQIRNLLKEGGLTLINPEKQLAFNIHIKKFDISWDAPTTVEEFIKLIQHPLVNRLNSMLSIGTATRIGIRFIWTALGDSGKQIHDYITNTYYSPAVRKTIYSWLDDVRDPMVRFSGRSGIYGINVGIGYQQEQEIQGNANIVNVVSTRDLIFFDFDFYKDTNTQFKSLDAFFNQVRPAVNEFLQNIVSVKG